MPRESGDAPGGVASGVDTEADTQHVFFTVNPCRSLYVPSDSFENPAIDMNTLLALSTTVTPAMTAYPGFNDDLMQVDAGDDDVEMPDASPMTYNA